MNTSASLISAASTAFHPIKSESGSRDSACEQTMENRAERHLPKDTCPKPQADNPEHSSTFGIEAGRQNCLTECATRGSFQVQSNGSIGLEICDADGVVVAWTTNAVVAQLICRALTDCEWSCGRYFNYQTHIKGQGR